MMMFNLIKEVNEEVNEVNYLFEVCQESKYSVDVLCEAADRWLGRVLVALRSGKNPFETMPGSKEVVAGLMLLNNPNNREALNISDEKFDKVAKEVSKDEGVQKYLARISTTHGKSLINKLEKHVEDSDKRDILIRKLAKLQQRFSTVKHRAGTTPGLTKSRNVNKLS